jgi:hypoxanthine phosphoribosyltransferase
MDVDIRGMNLKVLLDEDTIQSRIVEMAREISAEYAGQEVTLIVVLKGSILFAADLCRHLDIPSELEFMGLSSYGESTETSGVVRVTLDLSKPVNGKHILIIEDIVDTGLTMKYLLSNLSTREPASIRVCTLLHKPSRSVVEVPLDFVGFTIENHFVVGYGLDYQQKYRNLRFIGRMEEEA